MRVEREHITEQDLVLAASSELPERRSIAVREHLNRCETCRSRLSKIQETFASFAEARRSDLDAQLPPMEDARARLLSELANAAAEPRSWVAWLVRQSLQSRSALAFVSLLAVLGIFALSQYFDPQGKIPRTVHSDMLFAPDPMLTPGLTTSLSRSELCASDSPEPAAAIRRSVALEVFRMHGIPNPPPRVYELDYLIPPELGGASDVRNLWPQPYQGNMWNAYAKDALEDRLIRLVCEGEINLTSAQNDLARDWIAAYRKYFHTEAPLVEHASFLKDAPWE